MKNTSALINLQISWKATLRIQPAESALKGFQNEQETPEESPQNDNVNETVQIWNQVTAKINYIPEWMKETI